MGGNTVVTVDCASVTPAATIMETDGSFAFMPTAATIMQNQAVKFITSTTHNIVPNAGNDPGLTVPFNTTACLKFTAKGTFMFHCGPHGFQGTVTVQ